MAKTNEEILEAIKGLDPQNDEHWTADGLPRLDAVENLLGGDVSRKAVTNAAPDFTRAVASELVDVSKNGEPPVDGPTVETDGEEAAGAENKTAPEDESTEAKAVQQSPKSAQETGTASVTNPEQDEGDPLAEGPADFEAELDAEIAEVQQRVSDIQRYLEEGKRMLVEAEDELGKLVNEKNQHFPPLTQAEAIQQFQRNEQAKRAMARGVGGMSSPLDAALSARRKVRRQGAPTE